MSEDDIPREVIEYKIEEMKEWERKQSNTLKLQGVRTGRRMLEELLEQQ